MTFMKGLFRAVNQLYRECIDRSQGIDNQESDSEKSDVESTEDFRSVPTISLSQLNQTVSDGEAIITEIDIVSRVFEKLKSEKETDLNYLLTVAMAYANSLLSFLIFPHRKLQAFLFTLSIDTSNFTTLQYLLNYRVIMDSTDTLDHLGVLEDRIGKTHSWISLIRMDMAKRMRKTEIVIECLLRNNRALEIVEYVRANDPKFEIEKLFNLVSRYKNIERKNLWEQIEAWNISPGLKDTDRPVLSHKVVMLNL